VGTAASIAYHGLEAANVLAWFPESGRAPLAVHDHESPLRACVAPDLDDAVVAHPQYVAVVDRRPSGRSPREGDRDEALRLHDVLHVPVAQSVQVALLDEGLEASAYLFSTVADGSSASPTAGRAAPLGGIVEQRGESLSVAASERFIAGSD